MLQPGSKLPKNTVYSYFSLNLLIQDNILCVLPDLAWASWQEGYMKEKYKTLNVAHTIWDKRSLRMQTLANASAARIRLEGLWGDMFSRRFRKSGTSCTTSYRPDICISGLDIIRQITHSKPALEGACCLVNISCKWIISQAFVPVRLWRLPTSIREWFDEAFF